MRAILVTILVFLLSGLTAVEFVLDTSDDLDLSENGYESELVDLLGLEDVRRSRRENLNQFGAMSNSASRFLLEVYDATADQADDEDAGDELQRLRRHKRSSAGHEELDFITAQDRMEIEQSNNIITFASKAPPLPTTTATAKASNATSNALRLRFNINDVPHDFQLLHATLRLYQLPSTAASLSSLEERNVSISVFQRRSYPRGMPSYRLIDSLNTTLLHRGWLELNVTRLLARWLAVSRQTALPMGVAVPSELLIEANVFAGEGEGLGVAGGLAMPPSEVGIVGASEATHNNNNNINLQPFIVAYCNGPELMAKLQKLRLKREQQQQGPRRPQRGAGDFFVRPPPPLTDVYRMPKTCERLNFTLDFKDLHMHNWVIAPKKFEAYFCGGECNFPLNGHMNATNHAIVQTLMHLKQPNLPKPCCVPTLLGSISILHYLNEDSVNLSRYPQSVARECGCH